MDHAALEAYVGHSKLYDRVFGELVPASYRTRAAEAADRKRYVDNGNAALEDDWPAFTSMLAERLAEPRYGLKTGLDGLDRATPGGLVQTTLLFGPTGSGKSALAADLLLRVLDHNPDVGGVLFTTELSKTTVYSRLLGREVGVPCTALHEVPADRLAEAGAAVREKYGSRLMVIGLPRQDGAHPLTVDDMKGRFVRLKKKTGVGRVVTVIDPINLIDPTDYLPEGEPPTDADVDRGRLRLVQTFHHWTTSPERPEGDPVVVVAEVRKPAHSGQPITLSDVLGPAAVGFRYHWAFGVEPDRHADQAADVLRVDLVLDKAKDGGTRGAIPLDFLHRKYRFAHRAPAPPAAGRAPAVHRPAGGRPCTTRKGAKT